MREKKTQYLILKVDGGLFLASVTGITIARGSFRLQSSVGDGFAGRKFAVLAPVFFPHENFLLIEVMQ
jgi:hypothetical protein